MFFFFLYFMLIVLFNTQFKNKNVTTLIKFYLFHNTMHIQSTYNTTIKLKKIV